MESCECRWCGFFVHVKVVVGQVVNDNCHTRGVDEVLASSSHCGAKDIDSAIVIDVFDAFPVFRSCAVARLSTWDDACGVHNEVRMVVFESSVDAVLRSKVCVKKSIDLAPEKLVRRSNVKRVYLPLWMFVFQREHEVSAEEADASDQNAEVGVVRHEGEVAVYQEVSM